jgi:hypothetical protein
MRAFKSSKSPAGAAAVAVPAADRPLAFRVVLFCPDFIEEVGNARCVLIHADRLVPQRAVAIAVANYPADKPGTPDSLRRFKPKLRERVPASDQKRARRT